VEVWGGGIGWRYGLSCGWRCMEMFVYQRERTPQHRCSSTPLNPYYLLLSHCRPLFTYTLKQVMKPLIDEMKQAVSSDANASPNASPAATPLAASGNSFVRSDRG